MTATLRKPSVVASFDELLGRHVSMRSMALLRVFVGPIVLLHLRPFFGHFYGDTFNEPYVSWYPEAPRAVYFALLGVAAVAAVFMCVGLFTRVATVTTFAIVAYNLFLSTTHFHNNRAYLVIVLAALALAPCGREISVDAWLRRRRGLPALDTYAPAWPLWLLRFECAAVYAASGTSKLLDPDWFGGTVSWMRTVESKPDLEALPSPLISILTNRDFHTFAAKLVIATELFIALGLWSRRTRYAAVWVAVIFHVSIQFSAAVEVFSVLGIAVLVIWAVPSTRDRVLIVDPTSRWRAVVQRLDWLVRFRIEPGPGPAVIDRDGTPQGLSLALSRLPLTAWFALPTRLPQRLRRRRTRRSA
jgi:uncharacterized membrane protein YphA (DoxX/SURF4 family)